MSGMILEIDDLHVSVDGKDILKGITLSIPAGEVHAVMGPNGSGKSTLSYTLAGRDGYLAELHGCGGRRAAPGGAAFVRAPGCVGHDERNSLDGGT